MARKVDQIIARGGRPDDPGFAGLSYWEAARTMPAVGATAEKSVAPVHAQGSGVAAMAVKYQ